MRLLYHFRLNVMLGFLWPGVECSVLNDINAVSDSARVARRTVWKLRSAQPGFCNPRNRSARHSSAIGCCRCQGRRTAGKEWRRNLTPHLPGSLGGVCMKSRVVFRAARSETLDGAVPGPWSQWPCHRGTPSEEAERPRPGQQMP